MISLKQTIESLIGQKAYKFGKVWNAKESVVAIVPILLKEKPVDRTYVLLEETKDVEIKDSGGISKLIVGNKNQVPIYIRSGTIMKGQGTQSRVIEEGKILDSNKSQEVDVRCVHQSHPIRQNAKFEPSEPAPLSIQHSLYANVEHKQSMVWSSVRNFSMNYAPRSSMSSVRRSIIEPQTDNLLNIVSNDEYTKILDKYIRELPSLENQVGIIVIDMEGVLGVELFDHPDSWKAASINVIKKYGEVFTKPSKVVFTVQLDESRIKEVLEGFFDQVIQQSQGDGTFKLHGTWATGEYTIFGHKLIHLIAIRREIGFKHNETSTRVMHRVPSINDVVLRQSRRPIESYGGCYGMGYQDEPQPFFGTFYQSKAKRTLVRMETDTSLQNQPESKVLLSGFDTKLLDKVDGYANKLHSGNRSKAMQSLAKSGLEKEEFL